LLDGRWHLNGRRTPGDGHFTTTKARRHRDIRRSPAGLLTITETGGRLSSLPTVRNTTRALTRHYTDHLDLHGDVLEIGGHRLAKCAIGLFPEPRFRYHDLNLVTSDIPNTIIGDITGCADVIEDESFDIVFSSDVFEHIDRPWLAAQEITRILKPGGIAVTHTLFSWRNHPCPIDYWRYSAECLEFLFSDLTCLEKGYDLSQRRVDEPGFWASGEDSVPLDHRQTRTLSAQVESQDAELARLRRTISRPSLPERAYRKVRRAVTGVAGGRR
jgi:SAM-dependent methyltransferase